LAAAPVVSALPRLVIDWLPHETLAAGVPIWSSVLARMIDSTFTVPESVGFG